MHIVHTSNTPQVDPDRAYHEWYLRKFENAGIAFDPTLLAQLVREQFPEQPVFVEAFARCTREWPESELYTYFIDPAQHESKWKFAGSFILRHPVLGELVVDALDDPAVPSGISIGGMEYLDRVIARGADVDDAPRW